MLAPDPAPEDAKDRRRAYWRYNLRLTLGLLCLWAVVTFAPVYWARDFNRITLFGWPLAFYMAAQGALVAYLLIVWVYAHAMDRLDRRFGVDEGFDERLDTTGKIAGKTAGKIGNA
jgi:putative solute:sodium symporter small subunit